MGQKKSNFIRIGSFYAKVEKHLQRITNMQNEPIWVQEALRDLRAMYKLCYRSVDFPDSKYWIYYDSVFHLLGEYSFDRKSWCFQLASKMDSNDLTRIKKIESVVNLSNS